MKILFLGDSITDMGRNRDCDRSVGSYGHSYVFFTAGNLLAQDPLRYDILDRGISGNRIVDLYARVKADVWNQKPDVLSILIGINDIWHDLHENPNGVDPERFEKIYRMLIEDTKKVLPDVKIILCEPFVLHGTSTDGMWEYFSSKVPKYASIVRNIAEDMGLFFLPLQKILSDCAEKADASYYLADGVHPAVAGAKTISDAWVKFFRENVEPTVK